MTPEEHYQHAYKLDCEAGNYKEIEKHYQEAIRLSPYNPQYYSSWINYLQARGRSLGTKAAWCEAMVVCSKYYDILHYPVLLLALHRAQLDFAREVFDSIPLDRQQEEKFRNINEALTLLELADKEESINMSKEEQINCFSRLPDIYPSPVRYIKNWI